MVDPDQVVAALLANAGVGLVLGTDLFRGRVRPAGGGVPVKAVFVEAFGGSRNSRYMGTGRKVRDLSVIVRVRSDAGDSAGGRSLAAQVHAVLDHRVAPEVGYLDARCDQPSPVPIGQDALGAHEWSVNVTLRYAGPVPYQVGAITKGREGSPDVQVLASYPLAVDGACLLEITQAVDGEIPALFRLSLDNGETWAAEGLVVAQDNVAMVLPGLEIGFYVGAYEVGDTYSFALGDYVT